MMKETVMFAAVFLLLQLAAFRTVGADYSGNSSLSYPYNSTGTGAYVAFGESSIYRAHQLTVEAWVKPTYDIHAGSDSSYGHNWGSIATTRHYSGLYAYGGWVLLFDYTDGTLHFYSYYASYSWVNYHTNRAFWNSSLWYYVAVTYSPTLSENNLVFYVNGNIDAQHNETHALYYDPNAPLLVGAEASDTAIQYGGLIDEFRYWNVSRTTADIQNSWNRTLGNAETVNPSLIGYWRFDDGSGLYAQDSSLYSSVGTLMNGPQWITVGAPIVNDQTPPVIGQVYQQPSNVTGVLPNENVTVYANITDDLTGVEEAVLNYTTGNGMWNSAQMVNVAGSQYNGTIPEFPIGTNVTYVIMAEDGAGNAITTQEMQLVYQYTVTPEFSSILLMLVLMATISICAILLQRRSRKLDRPSSSEQPKLQ